MIPRIARMYDRPLPDVAAKAAPPSSLALRMRNSRLAADFEEAFLAEGLEEAVDWPSP